MTGEHIVKSFDEELKQITDSIVRMGGLATEQLEAAIEALLTLDETLAQRIIKTDKEINVIANNLDLMAVRILALRQPMAVDVRRIIASIKITTDLERIGDYAKGVAKHVRKMGGPQGGDTLEPVVEMARLCLRMLRDALASFQDLDADRAIEVREIDKQVDGLYKDLIEKLRTCMTATPDRVGTCTSLLFVARHLERIGDHIKNIANHIYYLVHGEPYRKKI